MSRSVSGLRAFVLHARADAGFAWQIRAFLIEAGDGASAALADAGGARVVLSDGWPASADCIGEAQEAIQQGKPIIPVMPAPLRAPAPAGIAQLGPIRFYVDPATPHSGFFDGQKRLVDALEACTEDATLPRERVHAGRN